MQVLQLSTYDGGQGAARAAFRLHRALRDHGTDSRMRVALASSGDAWVQAPRSKPRQALALARSTASWWLSKPQRSANPVTHSVAALPSRLDRELNASGADLLHLHWLQDEFLSVEAIGRLRGPVVWTLHDTWPFCGSEHYPLDSQDQRFALGYSRGNRAGLDRGVDLDRWTWLRKGKAWRSLLPRLQLIAPSRWMAEQASRSALLHGVPCQVLPNAIPQVFRPNEPSQARAALGWPQDKRLILFGAIDPTDPRKGADLLQAALRRLVLQNSDQLMAVILGQSQPKQTQDWPIPVLYSGRFHDDVSLALAYAAADVVVVSSRMDNLPQSATEAIACGTPVVAFDQGGMADVIAHRQTGWLAEPFDPEGLAQGILWALQRPQNQPVLSENFDRWRFDAVARAHGDLYAEVLSR